MNELCVNCGTEVDEDAYGEPEGAICSDYCHDIVLAQRDE